MMLSSREQDDWNGTMDLDARGKPQDGKREEREYLKCDYLL